MYKNTCNKSAIWRVDTVMKIDYNQLIGRKYHITTGYCILYSKIH